LKIKIISIFGGWYYFTTVHILNDVFTFPLKKLLINVSAEVFYPNIRFPQKYLRWWVQFCFIQDVLVYLLDSQALVSVNNFWKLYSKMIQGTLFQLNQNHTPLRMSVVWAPCRGICHANVLITVLFYDKFSTKPCMAPMQLSPPFSENCNKTLLDREIFQFTPSNMLHWDLVVVKYM
jgi:hypothetical protein